VSVLDCPAMRRLLVVLAAVVATGALAAGASSTPSVSSRPSAVAQARAARACGTFHASGHVVGVTVTRGDTACSEARKVLAEFVDGKGTTHPAGRNSYWTVGSWRCLPTASGGGACTRGGTNPRTAHESIEAAIK
jgi:hypothetical protein